jgi:hypothetical protein
MKFDLSRVEFTKLDIRRKIKIPSYLDENLAHYLGIHIGDGHLYKKPGDYRMFYDGHYINEYSWYNDYLSKLILNLFNRKVNARKGHNTIQIAFSSKAIHSFILK